MEEAEKFGTEIWDESASMAGTKGRGNGKLYGLATWANKLSKKDAGGAVR